MFEHGAVSRTSPEAVILLASLDEAFKFLALALSILRCIHRILYTGRRCLVQKFLELTRILLCRGLFDWTVCTFVGTWGSLEGFLGVLGSCRVFICFKVKISARQAYGLKGVSLRRAFPFAECWIQRANGLSQSTCRSLQGEFHYFQHFWGFGCFVLCVLDYGAEHMSLVFVLIQFRLGLAQVTA